jgi:outer membrane protein TolC
MTSRSRASALPSLAGSVNYNNYIEKGGSSYAFTNPDRMLSATVNLSVPLYSGGSVKNGLRAAKTRVEAGRASLRGTESSVFTNTVTAYMDVIRDAAIVGLQKNNVQVLEINLQATSDRFEIGNVTRTDVAQSRSRLALARASLRQAEANLVASRETYVRVVGHAPGLLEQPRRWRACPATLTGPSTMRSTTTPTWPPRASRARPPASTSRSRSQPQAEGLGGHDLAERQLSGQFNGRWPECHRNPGQRRDRLDPCSRAALRLHACVRPRPRRARRWSRKSAPSDR